MNELLQLLSYIFRFSYTMAPPSFLPLSLAEKLSHLLSKADLSTVLLMLPQNPSNSFLFLLLSFTSFSTFPPCLPTNMQVFLFF